MASQPSFAASACSLPSGRADDKRVTMSADRPASIGLHEGGEHLLPLGTKEIATQHRPCGDFYCFIHGKVMVSAIGETLNEAFLNALAKARASA